MPKSMAWAYSRKISPFENRLSSATVSAASCTLRVTVRSFDRNTFFAVCCEMVLPPNTTCRARRSRRSARCMATKSNPRWCSKCLSSIATVTSRYAVESTNPCGTTTCATLPFAHRPSARQPVVTSAAMTTIGILHLQILRRKTHPFSDAAPKASTQPPR